MKYLIQLIIFTIIGSLAISLLSGCTSPVEYYERAKAEMIKTNFSIALLDFDRAIKSKPDYIDAYIGRGDAKYKLGDMNGALADYNKAAELKPDLIPAPDLALTPEIIVTNEIAEQALALLEAKDYDKLEELASILRSCKDAYPDGVWKLACVYDGLVPANSESNEQWDSRLSSLEDWTLARRTSVTARVALANALVACAWRARGASEAVTSEQWRLFGKRLGEAKEVLVEARALKEKCPLYGRVLLRFATGASVKNSHFDVAFNEAIKDEPTFTSYYFRRVIYLLPRWYGTNGEWQSDLIKSADKIGGANGDMLYAQVIWNLNESAYVENPFMEDNVSWPRVDKGFEVIEKRFPDSLVAKIERVQLAILSRDAPAFIYCNNGYAKQSKHEWDAAILDYNKAIEIKTNYGDAYSHRGYSKTKKGDLAGAMADFKIALAINPKVSGTYYNRAMTEKALAQFDVELADLNKAIELNPNYTRAYMERGIVKQTKGDNAGATADFQKAMKIQNSGN